MKRHFAVPLVKGFKIIEDSKRNLDGHSKRFRYVMSHKTGKVEVVSIVGQDIYLKYHQAKNTKHAGRFFQKKLTPGAAWLDDLK